MSRVLPTPPNMPERRTVTLGQLKKVAIRLLFLLLGIAVLGLALGADDSTDISTGTGDQGASGSEDAGDSDVAADSAEVPTIEAADPTERSGEDQLMALVASGDASREHMPLYVDPATGEHPVYKLRPVPFSDAEAQLVTLDDLLNMALENNATLLGQGYNIEKGHYSVDQTYYAYDPQLAAGLNYSYRSGSGAVGTSHNAGASFDYTLPREYGDSFRVGYDLSASRVSSATSNYSYSGGLSLGYTRPLGRGAGRQLNRIPRYIASNNLQLSYEQLDDQTRQLKRSILDSYYQAVTARQAIDVRQRNLETALKQLERAVERYKVGLGIQADVLQAENNVLNQRSALLSAEKGYQDILDTLTTLVGLPQEYALAVDTGEALLARDAVLPDDLWDLVRNNSFELKSLNTQLANQRLQREQIENRLKPQLDLAVDYSGGANDAGFTNAVSSLSNNNVTVGVNWRTTRGERDTKASLAQNQLDLASLELDMQQTELELKGRVRERQRDLETKSEQIALAESNLAVTQQAYEIAVERNNVGLATTLDVIEAQEDVLAAELALLNARVAYHQTYRELLLLAGVI